MIKSASIVLKHAGEFDALSIDDYLESGGYNGLRLALKRLPAEILDEVERSGLRGRGGAGFPTGLKERFTRDACGGCDEIYLICNADEGEPGTFKDRIIMEEVPHRLIEGMAIAGHVIGASRGFLYIRGEYTEAIASMTAAVAQARERGILGPSMMNSGFPFDIEIRLGGGSYLCGEELTLIESLEGRRGYPRIKPPFPAEHGLWGRPTLVNNVETLCHAATIIERGAAFYQTLGLEKSRGTKIFCVSGRVNQPGHFEVEFGVTLRELIENLAGGMAEGLGFKGALLGGAAGTFVDASFLDLPLGYDTLKERGATLGSGAVIVLSDKDSVKAMLQSTLRFFKHESCGKCVPCRVGTAQLVKMTDSAGPWDTSALLKEAQYMADTSLCPLGQSPVLPVQSAIQYFESELAHA